MAKEYLLGATSNKSNEYEWKVKESIEKWRSRSNDLSLSTEGRNESKALLEQWNKPHIIEILQCRHFSNNNYENRFLSWHGPACFRKGQSLVETYKEIPRGPQGFTLPSDDNLLLHMISYLDYFTAHKMTLVAKRFKAIMNTFKRMRSKEMLDSMPFVLDKLDRKDRRTYWRRGEGVPELSFTKSWHPKYEVEHRGILCDDAIDFAKENNVFHSVEMSYSPEECRSVELRTYFARECMREYESFPLSAIEDKILENDIHRDGYISLLQEEEFECHYNIRFKILSRHQVTLQEAWTLFVERIIIDHNELYFSKKDVVPNRYLLWSLLAAADPSSIHLSHVHAGRSNDSRVDVYDHIALSFVVSGESVEVVGRIEQFGYS